MRIAIIGGTGVDEMAGFDSATQNSVVTRFGCADIVEAEIDGRQVYFVPRHGLAHDLLPGQINYRAQIAALKKLEVRRVIGLYAVGALDPKLSPGSFAVLGDFIDFTRRRACTFFDEDDSLIVHTDFTHPYCPVVSGLLSKACVNENVHFADNAIYVGVDGPRYETPAEVRLYQSWGAHVIGMTGLPEAVLAREAGICYGGIATIANLAAGLSPTPLAHNEVRAAVMRAADSLQKVLTRVLGEIEAAGDCDCSDNTGLLV